MLREGRSLVRWSFRSGSFLVRVAATSAVVLIRALAVQLTLTDRKDAVLLGLFGETLASVDDLKALHEYSVLAGALLAAFVLLVT